MSSIMRWRNGLMALSVMAITPVSHEVSEPHDLETGRAILFIPDLQPTSRALPLGRLPRERFSPWGDSGRSPFTRRHGEDRLPASGGTFTPPAAPPCAERRTTAAGW